MEEFFSGERILNKKPAYYRTLEEPDLLGLSRACMGNQRYRLECSLRIFWWVHPYIFPHIDHFFLFACTNYSILDLTVSRVHQEVLGLVHPSRGISMIFPRFILQRIDKKPEDGSTPTDTLYLFNHHTRKMDFSIDDQNP